jgi:hypothetical protein
MLTGQRHENSVLFSLSNLEALAAPSTQASLNPRPGVSSSSPEGSGLIDIRSMAAMTMGSRGETPRPSADLPTFGAPQFSPVAPVLLPIGQASGPPKWIYALIGVLLLLAIGLGFITYRIASRPAVVATPAPVPTAPVAAPKPAPAAPAVTQPATPPVTPPAPTNEVLPPRETPKASVATADHAKGARKAAPKGTKPGHGGEVASAGGAAAGTSPGRVEPTEKPMTGKPDKLDELLNAAIGTKPKAGPRGGDEEAAPKKAAAPATPSLPVLEKGDIVRAMMAVNPKVKDCYNQYKVPGTAMVTMKLARGGRVAGATVTGKFAGTPTGACVEAAAKTAKFPQTDAQSFDYPFSLH